MKLIPDYQSLLTFMKIDNNGVGIVNNDASNSSVWWTSNPLFNSTA